MVPFHPPLPSGRNVKCCVMVKKSDGSLQTCGTMLKHAIGGPTTNLLKHLKACHPEEARLCLEKSRHPRAKIALKRLNDLSKEQCIQNSGLKRSKRFSSTSSQASSLKTRELRSGYENRSIIYCSINLRPFQIFDEKLFRSLLKTSKEEVPEGLRQSFGLQESISTLKLHFEEVQCHIQESLVQEGCTPGKASWVLQLDKWALPEMSLQYILLYVTRVSSSFNVTRYGLAVKAISGASSSDMSSATAEIVTETTAKFWGGDVKPSEVFHVCIHGQCEDFVAAANELQIPSLPNVTSSLKTLLWGALSGKTKDESLASFVSEMRRAATVSAVKRDETLANTAPELSGGDHGGFDVIHATWQMLSEVLLRSEQPGSECVPSTGALVSADLEKLRELVGVFDAFEEVNYTLRKVRAF